VTYGLEIRPEAITDIEEAAQWYEDRELGLGADFSQTIFAGIESLRTRASDSPPARSPTQCPLDFGASISLPDCLSSAE